MTVKSIYLDAGWFKKFGFGDLMVVPDVSVICRACGEFQPIKWDVSAQKFRIDEKHVDGCQDKGPECSS